MKKNFNKVVLAAILAMGSAFGFSGAVSAKDNGVSDVTSEKTKDYDCIVKYQGAMENSKWKCRDGKDDFINEPTALLKVAMNKLVQDQYGHFKRSKAQKSMSLFSIRIDNKGNLVKVIPVEPVKKGKLGAAAYLTPENYDCVIKYRGDISDINWSCKTENGKTIKVPSAKLKKAVAQVIKEQSKILKDGKYEAADVKVRLHLNAEGELVKTTSSVHAYSPTLIKKQQEALERYNKAKLAR